MKKQLYPKIGLALGSGGAKGLAHLGVLKTLEKHQIPIDYIAGSSAGALAGALYSSIRDIAKIEEQIFNFSRIKGISLIDLTIRGGIIKGKKAEDYIDTLLKEDDFTSLSIPLSIIATDINTAEPVILQEGNLIKAIRASIAVPGFFQPLKYKNYLLADGGMSNPVPVDVLYKMGADITIGVNLDSVYTENPIVDMPSLSLIPLYTVTVLRHTLGKHSIRGADVVIEPPDVYRIGLMGWNYVFDNEKAKQIIELGEKEAEKAIPRIKSAIAEYQYTKTYRGKFMTFINTVRNITLKLR